MSSRRFCSSSGLKNENKRKRKDIKIKKKEDTWSLQKKCGTQSNGDTNSN